MLQLITYFYYRSPLKLEEKVVVGLKPETVSTNDSLNIFIQNGNKKGILTWGWDCLGKLNMVRWFVWTQKQTEQNKSMYGHSPRPRLYTHIWEF